MSEHLSPIAHVRRARDIGKIVLLGVLDRIDTHFANALNPPEVDYPRFTDYVPEAPALTEDELGGTA